MKVEDQIEWRVESGGREKASSCTRHEVKSARYGLRKKRCFNCTFKGGVVHRASSVTRLGDF